jgi:hypothetical protein
MSRFGGRIQKRLKSGSRSQPRLTHQRDTAPTKQLLRIVVYCRRLLRAVHPTRVTVQPTPSNSMGEVDAVRGRSGTYFTRVEVEEFHIRTQHACSHILIVYSFFAFVFSDISGQTFIIQRDS